MTIGNIFVLNYYRKFDGFLKSSSFVLLYIKMVGTVYLHTLLSYIAVHKYWGEKKLLPSLLH